MKLVEITDPNAWNEYVSRHPQGHPLQLWGWGEAKRASGWNARRFVLQAGSEWTAGVQVLLWQIPRTGRFIAYIPRGPIVDPTNPAMVILLRELVAWCGDHRVLYIRVEPAWTAAKLPFGWIKAAHSLQMSETYTIDLLKSESDLLEEMSKKHRQYIRKSQRDGIAVKRETSGDLGPMYEIYSQTAARAGFGIHTENYYADLNRLLGENGHLYYAEFEGRRVAFLWLAAAGETSFELYGGVTPEGQEIKANYYLKWHAILAMKSAGYQMYDFNGRLNEGVSRFKDGFGPDETNYIGTWDFPLHKLGYNLWERLWPIAKPIGRILRKSRH